MKSKYEFLELPMDSIKVSEWNPRKTFDEEKLDALEQSLNTHGPLEEISVRPDGDGKYEIINGERRFRSELKLGTQAIRVKVFDVDEWEALEQRLNESVHYTPEEREAAVWKLYTHYNDRVKEPDKVIAKRIHSSTGIPLGTVRELIEAHKDREEASGSSKKVIETAKYRDLNKTKGLPKKVRDALLKRRKEKAERFIPVAQFDGIISEIKKVPDVIKDLAAKDEKVASYIQDSMQEVIEGCQLEIAEGDISLNGIEIELRNDAYIDQGAKSELTKIQTDESRVNRVFNQVTETITVLRPDFIKRIHYPENRQKALSMIFKLRLELDNLLREFNVGEVTDGQEIQR